MRNPGQEAFRKAANEVVGPCKEYSWRLRVEDGVVIRRGLFEVHISIDEIAKVSRFSWLDRLAESQLWGDGVSITTTEGSTSRTPVERQKAQEFIRDIESVRERVRSLFEAQELAETQLRDDIPYSEEKREEPTPVADKSASIVMSEQGEPEIIWVRLAILASFVFAAGGLLLAIFLVLDDPTASWWGLLAWPYIFWGLWWGLVTFWPMYRAALMSWGIFALPYFAVYVAWAALFGSFGGGIYKFVQFVKMLREYERPAKSEPESKKQE